METNIPAAPPNIPPVEPQPIPQNAAYDQKMNTVFSVLGIIIKSIGKLIAQIIGAIVK